MSGRGNEEEIKRRVLDIFGEDIRFPRLKGKLGFDDTVNDLIHKCATCIPEEFPGNVQRLVASIPLAWRDEEFEDDLQECKEDAEYSTPVIFCGVAVLEDYMPVRRETREEWKWDRVYNASLNLFNRRDMLIPKRLGEVVSSHE
jgi:hypothetical protein